MKKLLLNILAISVLSANAQITDLPVTANLTSVCNGTSSIISTTGSQVRTFYSLRNSSNAVIDGPIGGTGNDLDFNTGNLTSTDTYNVQASQYIGGNLVFDGVDDYVNLGSSSRAITSLVTVGCWVKTSATGTAQFIMSKYNSVGFILFIDTNGKARFDGKGGGGGNYVSSGPSLTSVNDGQWHYIVGAVNNSITTRTWKIYVDGVLESTGTSNVGGDFNIASTLLIGLYNNSYFTGEIDDVQIWRVELTAATIKENMANCLNGSEASLRGWFKFDEGSGTTVTDLSTMVTNGTLTNMNSATSWVANSPAPCGTATSFQMTQTAAINVITINDETVSGPTTVCSGLATTITTGSSVVGIDYSLLDGNGNVVDGPLAGTGNALNFGTEALTSNTTYSVFGGLTLAPTNNALSFDTQGHYVSLSNSDRGVSDKVTISCWVKTSFSGAQQNIVDKYDGISGYQLIMSATGKISFGGRQGNGNFGYYSSGVSTTSINDGQWHYVTGSARVVDNIPAQWIVTIDGVLEASSNPGTFINATLAGTGTIFVGASNVATDWFTGEIDDLSIWNDELTLAEIQSNMNNCLTGSETNLVGLFDFNDNNTGTLLDHTLTINGSLVNFHTASDWVASNASNCSTPAYDCSLTMTQTVAVTVITAFNLFETTSVCTGGNYTFPDGTTQNNITAQVVHTSAFQISGSTCDSIIITTVNVNPTYSLQVTDTICSGDNYTFPDGTTQSNVTSTVVYTSNLLTVGAGCDSVIQTTIAFYIADQTVTATNNSYCGAGSQSTTIVTGSSETGVEYTLRDASNAIIDGPLSGTGSALTFNTGTLNATTTYNVYAETGEYTNTALDFDGSNDYVNASADNRGITNQLTVGAWIRLSATGSAQFIAGKYNGVNGFSLYVNASGKVTMDGRDGSGGYKSSGFSTTSVNDNQWHYVVGVINASTGVWSVYIDGAIESSANVSTGSTMANPSLMTVGAYATNYFTGAIGEFTCWNTALNLTEIQSFTNNGVVGNEANVVAHFNFDDLSGTVLTDVSTSSINGTLVSMDPATDWIFDNSMICSAQMNQTATVSIIPTYNLAETQAVCSGSSYTFPDGSTQNNITSQVVYTSNLQTVIGSCDSIIVTTLNINPTYNQAQSATVCSGSSYTFPDGTTQNNITSQVVYTNNLTTVATSCDSIIVTTVSVNPAYNITETNAVCTGGNYTFPDGSTQSNITSQVVYTSNLTTVGTSCDSVIVTTVNVNPTYNLAETFSVCNGGSYTFPDGSTQNNLTSQVVYTSNLTTAGAGCDSIITTIVNINPTYSLAETAYVCNNGNYTFPDGTTQNNITSQVVYTSNLSTLGNGCDSTIVTTVNVTPLYNISVTDAVCTGESYAFPDGTITTNITSQVIHTSNLTTVMASCDSVIITTINIITAYNEAETVEVCSGANYTFPDLTTQNNITSQIVYTSNLQSVGGCDSNVVTTVNIASEYNLSETVSVCDGSSYTFPDGTTQSNITSQVVYTSNLQTVGVGCDSVVVTTVNINPGYSQTESADVCSGSSYTFPDGTTQSNLTAQVVYTSNLQTVGFGCDSIIITTVNVHEATNQSETITVCNGESHTFPDGTTQSNITAQVVYTSTLQTVVAGCDSIIVTTVNVGQTYNSAVSVDKCIGSSYTFPDGTIETNITQQTIQTSNLQTVTGGCDSIIITTVNVSSGQAYNFTESFDVCSGSSYTFPDGSTQSNITTTVVYASNLQTTGGCDSIFTTTINVNPTYNLTVVDSICSGGSYTFPDGSVQNDIFAQVVYTSNFQTVAGGCDSVIVTTVNLNTPINVNTTANGAIITAAQTGASYVWYDCDNGNSIVAGETGVSFTATASGNYSVGITVNGCVDNSVCVNVVLTTGIEEVVIDQISIFPNPVSSQLTIKTNSTKIESIQLIDIIGKTIKVKVSNNNKLDVSTLPKGAYILVINSNNGISQHKIIKE